MLLSKIFPLIWNNIFVNFGDKYLHELIRMRRTSL